MELKDKIHKIKESRLTPAEKFLYNIFWNLKAYYSDEYSNLIFYKKYNEVLFIYDNQKGLFWCYYDKIWLVLETNYDINKLDIYSLIKDLVKCTLKLKDVVPLYSNYKFYSSNMVNTKLKELNENNR